MGSRALCRGSFRSLSLTPSEWLFKICKVSSDSRHRATASLKLSLSEILQLGKLWDSSTMIQVYNNLVEPTSYVNAGKLVGNRNFYNNDYVVSGGSRYPEQTVRRIYRFSVVPATFPL
jgi:hypothetical protein